MFDKNSRAEYSEPDTPAPRALRARPTSVITPALIAINVLIFAAMVATGASPMEPSGRDMVRWGADFAPYTIEGGQWWRLFTSMFLHFGVVHLGFNMYVLYQVGITTEILYGRVKYLFIYVLAGLMGSVVSLHVHPDSVGAGASGAIFGVYGAFLGYLLMRRALIPKPAMAQMTQSAVVFLGINLVYGLATTTTDLAAHIGGLATGFVLGCYFNYGTGADAAR